MTKAKMITRLVKNVNTKSTMKRSVSKIKKISRKQFIKIIKLKMSKLDINDLAGLPIV